MAKLNLKKEIEKLRSDYFYYGEGGSKYLSNSDIKILFQDPAQFRVKVYENENLAKGRLFHQLLLEPKKSNDFITYDGGVRNAAYREFLKENNLGFALKTSEADEVKEMATWFLDESNTKTASLREYIYRFGAKYEEPMIKELHGHLFKGKADVVTDNIIIDIKTTADIYRFPNLASNYFYDTQAYIYQELFQMPMVFFVIGKTKKKYGVFDEDYYDVAVFNTSPEFIAKGKAKVEHALNHYSMYYGKSKTESIKDIVFKGVLT